MFTCFIGNRYPSKKTTVTMIMIDKTFFNFISPPSGIKKRKRRFVSSSTYYLFSFSQVYHTTFVYWHLLSFTVTYCHFVPTVGTKSLIILLFKYLTVYVILELEKEIVLTVCLGLYVTYQKSNRTDQSLRLFF